MNYFVIFSGSLLSSWSVDEEPGAKRIPQFLETTCTTEIWDQTLNVAITPHIEKIATTAEKFVESNLTDR